MLAPDSSVTCFTISSPILFLTVLDSGTGFRALIIGVGLILLYHLRPLSHLQVSSASPHPIQLLAVLGPGTCFESLITGVGLILSYYLRFCFLLSYHLKLEVPSQLQSSCWLCFTWVFVFGLDH